MDICVLSRVGGFRLGKLVSFLSNENKQMEVAFTYVNTQTLCRTLDGVVGNALDTLIQLTVNLSTLLHSILCPIMYTPSSLFKVVLIVHYFPEIPEILS